MFASLSELRDLERDTLRRITQVGEFAKLGQLHATAGVAAASINEKGPIDVHLDFTLDVRLRGDRQGKPVPRRIDLGALVELTPDKRSIRNASYSLLICRYADPSTSPIVRKVHFDYEPEEFRVAAEPKPSVHMQICGKLSRHHVAAGYLDSRLHGLYPRWEKPRIPLPPTSLALLLNWLLLEFQADPASQAILKAPAWRAMVVRAERTVLTPYFKAATAFLTGAANSDKRFLQTHLYGMSAS